MIDHLVFNGNREARPATDHLYYGVVWGCSRCNFTNNIITRTAHLCALCAARSANPSCSPEMDIKDRVVVSNNLFALNGLHESGPDWSGARWSDGFTVHDYSNSVFAGNEFVDNTDVDFDLGGCRNCTIQNNTIRHTGSCRRASFAAMLIGAWPGSPQNGMCTSGNYTGTVFSNNSIDCGENRMCFFGLGIGSHAWYISSVYGGSVHNNTVINAQQGVTLDDISEMEVYNNYATGSAGMDYWMEEDTQSIYTSKDTLGTAYIYKDWDLYYSKWENVSFISGCTASENYAEFISQDVPATMTAGQTYTVSVTMRNRGSNTWTAAGNYRLGSQNPQDNHIWNGGGVGLSSGEYIEPIDLDTKTFTFAVTAPTAPGIYNFQWRVLQEYVEWFGENSSNIVVTVVTTTTTTTMTTTSTTTTATSSTMTTSTTTSSTSSTSTTTTSTASSTSSSSTTTSTIANTTTSTTPLQCVMPGNDPPCDDMSLSEAVGGIYEWVIGNLGLENS